MSETMTPRPGAPDRRQFLYGGILLGAVAAGLALAPRRSVAPLAPGALDAAIPLTIGPWRFASESGLVVPQPDALSERIYDQVLTRIYAADGLPPVMLLIAYGSVQDSGLALHRPEICYFGAGYEIGPVTHRPLAGLPGAGAIASYLAATRPDRAEQIFYWTRIGDRFVTDTAEEKLVVIRANLRRILPDGILVRSSVASADGADSLGVLERFNALLLGSVGEAGRGLLLGPGA